MDVHRAARIAAVGHGGQILVSQATRELAAEAELRDLGEHRLKDLARAERIWQLGDREFPPLRSLHRTRLPVVASPLIGRAAELERIEDEIRAGAKLLTVTGAGGSGKTRLALQAAAQLSDEFVGGTYFVALAPLSDAASLHGAVADALELQPDDDIAERLRASRALLVLDNAEHLQDVEHEIAKLRVGDTALLVTSRARLRLSGEHELTLDPLPEDDALELFVTRAAERGRRVDNDDLARAICRRLDHLPLALELAAARLAVLAPGALLDRLDHALPLLTEGARDVDERQRTLRSTIDWSFRLLTERAQRALRRLSIFRGGFTLEAAAAVADADLDVVTELVEQNLLKRAGDHDRYLMLETIREFGLEEQDVDLALAHAGYYLDFVRTNEPEFRGPRTSEFLEWYRLEAENTWAALDELVAADQIEAAWELAVFLQFFWVAAGGVRRATRWLRHEGARSVGRTTGWVRARLCLANLLAGIAEVEESARLLDEVEPYALAGGDARCLVELYRARGLVARSVRDFRASAEYASKEFDYARELDERTQLFALAHVAGALFELGDFDGAEALVLPVRGRLAALGDLFNEAGLLQLLAEIAGERGDYSTSAQYLDEANRYLAEMGAWTHLAGVVVAKGFYAMSAGDYDGARRAFADALRVVEEQNVEIELSELIDHIAVACATENRSAAGRIYSTVTQRRAALGLPRLDRDMPVYERVLGVDELVGEPLDWDEAVALARSLVEPYLD
jgi:predicted ATPase